MEKYYPDYTTPFETFESKFVRRNISGSKTKPVIRNELYRNLWDRNISLCRQYVLRDPVSRWPAPPVTSGLLKSAWPATQKSTTTSLLNDSFGKKTPQQLLELLLLFFLNNDLSCERYQVNF